MGFTHRNLSEQIFGSSRRHTMAHIRTNPHLTAQLRNLHMLNLLRLPIFLNALPNTTSILEMKYIMQIYFLNKYFSSRGDSLSTLRHHIQISSYFFGSLSVSMNQKLELFLNQPPPVKFPRNISKISGCFFYSRPIFCLI